MPDSAIPMATCGSCRNSRLTFDLDLPVNLAKPARRELVEAGYWRLEQLTEISEGEVKQLHGVGPKALEQLRRALSTNGLSFADGKGRKE